MNKLEGKCCLVTGGGGFIGSTIVDQLVAAGVSEIRVIDNFVRGTWNNLAWAMDHGNVKVIDGDIRDASLVSRNMRGVDYVFHQAALRITRCAEAPREAVEVLIDGTLNVLEAAVEHKVTKVIAASSASVYGEPSYLPIRSITERCTGAENSPTNRCSGPISILLACSISPSVLSTFSVLAWTSRGYIPKC
jgi:UDP-glucose 4-epimerase